MEITWKLGLIIGLAAILAIGNAVQYYESLSGIVTQFVFSFALYLAVIMMLRWGYIKIRSYTMAS